MTMRYELLAHRILERAAVQFPNKQIITRTREGTHRYSYADMFGRTARLGNALRNLGIGPGDRVGTFAWNTYRHLEAYFAPPSIGAVVHTINIRLAADKYHPAVVHEYSIIGLCYTSATIGLLKGVAYSHRNSPGGGFPTTWSSSMKSPKPGWANSIRNCCEIVSNTTASMVSRLTVS